MTEATPAEGKGGGGGEGRGRFKVGEEDGETREEFYKGNGEA